VAARATDDGMVSIQIRALSDEAARLMCAIEVCAGIEISVETNEPGWDGDPVDYDACVAALMG
jgi:hypothetical protein